MRTDFKNESEGLKSTVVNYMAAFVRGDPEAVLALYADDGVLMAPVGPEIEGKSNLANIYPGLFAAVAFNSVTEVTEVLQISSTWGLVRSATKGTETDKASGEVKNTSYLELFVLRKSETSAWQIARYNTTQIPA